MPSWVSRPGCARYPPHSIAPRGEEPMSPEISVVHVSSAAPLPVAEWSKSSSERLLLGTSQRRLDQIAASGLPALSDAGIVILKATSADPLPDELRGALPAPLAVLTSQWSFEDCLMVPRDVLPATAPGSLWELAAEVALSGTAVTWRTLPAGTGDAAASTPASLPRLAPPAPAAGLRWLERLIPRAVQTALPRPASRTDAVALTAGLLQVHDFLDASHAQSQRIEGEGRNRAGDYWHAIMHRREPDYGNSKYWFRRVGRHPVFARLASTAAELLQNSPADQAKAWSRRVLPGGEWDPLAFVDLCSEAARDEESPLAVCARRIQWTEMQLLLLETWRDAAG